MAVITWIFNYDEEDLLGLPIFTFLPDSHTFKESVIPLAQIISSPKTSQIIQKFYDFPTYKYSASFTFINHQHLKQFLNFIHSLNGNQRKFWLPVWHRNFKLTKPVFSSEAVITVANTKFFQFIPPKLLQKLRLFLFKPLSNNKFLFIVRKITQVVELNDYEEQIYFPKPINYNFSLADPVFIGKLALVRLATDTVNLRFLFSVNQEFKNYSIVKTNLEFLELTFEWLNS